MMILRSTPPSPFGRKVNIAASVLGLSAEITDRDSRHQRSGRYGAAAKSARKNSGAGDRGRHRALRFARDPGISRSSRRRRKNHSARAERALCRAAPAGAGRRHDRRADPADLRGAAGGRPSITCRNGSITRPTRSSAGSPRSRPIRRRSVRFPMSDISRSPAFSATATCVFRAPGATIIRSSPPGSISFAAQVPAFGADENRGVASLQLTSARRRIHFPRFGGR